MSEWEDIRLAEIATPVARPVVVVPGDSYRTLGVRWWGEGAYERATIDGSQTAARTLSVVKKGDLIINKIWVRNGSTAIAGAEVDGCSASGEFPTFVLDLNRVMPEWIHWQTKTRNFWSKCDALSRGTSGKNRIKPELFLSIRVPLPPLDVQRQVVAQIADLASQIHEAGALRRQAAGEVEELWASSLAATFGGTRHPTESLESVCDAIVDNLHSTPRYDGDEFPCIRSQDVGWGTMNFESALRTSKAEFTERTRRSEPRAGDIVFVREGDVGRCAVVSGKYRFSLGQRVMIFRPSSRIEPRFLMLQLMSPPVLEKQILQGKTGTTSHHVNIKHLREVKVVLPPLAEQRSIVTELDSLQAEIDALQSLQSEVTLELDALLPSVLNRAFRGEL